MKKIEAIIREEKLEPVKMSTGDSGISWYDYHRSQRSR